ncbi:hypothetical protein [Erwinia billingiae]|uniref:hypothetical protein n=1 Tax=Erwinia billingiae TaxID=182337 RepID=UPI0005A23C79|nr:hypothetical protein [Erwinia billingiae]
MIVLSDNDVIIKLAQCNLIPSLNTIFGYEMGEIYVNPAAKFQILKKKDKALRMCGSELVVQRVGEFLEAVQPIPEVKDNSLIETLQSIPKIDEGEQLLLATCMENPDSIFMTGDKNCLSAVMQNQDKLSGFHARLINSVVTFESAILLSVESLGFETVLAQLRSHPKATEDGLMRAALSSDHYDGVCGCFFSFTRAHYDYLAFKTRLPEQGWLL